MSETTFMGLRESALRTRLVSIDGEQRRLLGKWDAWSIDRKDQLAHEKEVVNARLHEITTNQTTQEKDDGE